MSAVIVETRIVIARPRAEVADYASDPGNATTWYANIKAVEWDAVEPVVVGSRMAFVAQFLGRRLSYTYEVTEFVPGRRFVMRTHQGPFEMETTYEWEDAPNGSTQMILRNSGEPSGFSKIAAPAIARAMKRANTKDLNLLKSVLESRPST